MMTTPLTDEAMRLETALHHAIATHRKTEIAARATRPAGPSPLLLATLGFAVPTARSAGSGISHRLAEEIEARLQAERRRLQRLARTGSPLYDVNRHIAVAAALDGRKPAATLAKEAGSALSNRLPGRVLNARFFKRWPRPAAPAGALQGHIPRGMKGAKTGIPDLTDVFISTPI